MLSANARVAQSRCAEGIDFLRINVLPAVPIISPGNEIFAPPGSYNFGRFLIAAARIVVYAKVYAAPAAVQANPLSEGIAKAAATVVPAYKKLSGLNGNRFWAKMKR